eukprot:1195024-Prorocentrum_minimum.AAC.4
MAASRRSCLLRLVPAPGISSRPCSDWFPPRVYPPVPAPIGSRPGYILPSLLRLVPAPGISCRLCSDWCLPRFALLFAPLAQEGDNGEQAERGAVDGKDAGMAGQDFKGTAVSRNGRRSGSTSGTATSRPKDIGDLEAVKLTSGTVGNNARGRGGRVALKSVNPPPLQRRSLWGSSEDYGAWVAGVKEATTPAQLVYLCGLLSVHAAANLRLSKSARAELDSKTPWAGGRLDELYRNGYLPEVDEAWEEEEEEEEEEERKEEQEAGVFVVESVLDKRTTSALGKGGQSVERVEYRVKWDGFPVSEATWEPVENLGNVKRMVAAFEASLQS